jgi:hypothetical protein
MPSQQHQQRHDDAGTHSFILLLRRDYRGTQCSNSTSGPLVGPLPCGPTHVTAAIGLWTSEYER